MIFQNLFFINQARISRKSFWLGHLFLLVCLIIAGFIILVGAGGHRIGLFLNLGVTLLFVAGDIYLFVKRYHDRDKSGWWYLLTVIPIVGIWCWIEAGFLQGTTGPNRFGADPRLSSMLTEMA